jgi:fatty-acyl-CoA synthase
VANALDAQKLPQGTRIATLAWNGYRHLELYFGVSGSGRVLHTINPRLHPDQLAWIANHAEDQVLCFDMTFLPLVQAVHAKCTTITHFVALCDADKLPEGTGIPNLVSYEAWMGQQSDAYDWPQLDENTACSLCYTSGTTGNPKGVLYSHRSTVLHTMAAALPDCLGCSASDAILPVVPMFHVNSWGIVYLAPMTGAKLVLPGPGLDGKSLYELFESERVTISAGVPTVWQGLLAHVEANSLRFSTMRKSAIGGSACPPSMIRKFRDAYGVQVIHAWGMTEMSPIGTAAAFKAAHHALDDEGQLAVRSTQGRALYGVDMKITSEDGTELPWDGQASGDLLVRGPWIIDTYFMGEGGNPLVRDADGNGWFPTGDVAKITPEGYMVITDRSKDVIKSGGEWIGSIDLENIAMAHPAVAMAACIAAYHPKWDERPLLVVVRKPGMTVTREELLAFYEGKIAKWWTPDDVVFTDAIPLGGTGKMQKNKLREQFKTHQLPTV